MVEKSAPPEKRLELTELQERFARKYVELLGNGRAAAKAAGCECDSDESFDVSASVLLRNSKVVSRIEQIRERSLKRTEITAARVLNELARVAFASMGDFAEWNGQRVSLRDSSELSQDELAAVEEVSETVNQTGSNVKIKLASKLGALNTLCKNLGLTPDKLEHTGDGGGPIQLEHGLSAAKVDEIKRSLLGIEPATDPEADK